MFAVHQNSIDSLKRNMLIMNCATSAKMNTIEISHITSASLPYLLSLPSASPNRANGPFCASCTVSMKRPLPYSGKTGNSNARQMFGMGPDHNWPEPHASRTETHKTDYGKIATVHHNYYQISQTVHYNNHSDFTLCFSVEKQLLEHKVDDEARKAEEAKKAAEEAQKAEEAKK
ncbi:hypothetical protein DdX_18613 [Ditylenchus destructor]|uniref:Uncharacterized protein n=1 Tax=Ditylenchus destructor TaxID=166010 RepID=A0AAD4QSR4_9BILA|nr:hypothetical protein DdX_18613 [Ditylenchus destructor]